MPLLQYSTGITTVGFRLRQAAHVQIAKCVCLLY